MNKQRLVVLSLGMFALGLATAYSTTPATGEGSKETPNMVYELRTYTTHPGRLDALNKRFRDHTMRIFEKHGMKNIAYWIPDDDEHKNNTLVYVISHKSREAADESWKAFGADPQWKAARDESEKDGKIVMKVERQFLNPTDYSPMK